LKINKKNDGVRVFEPTDPEIIWVKGIVE